MPRHFLPILLALSASSLSADDRNIDFDKQVDFTRFRTYSLRRGNITAKGPDLNTSIVKNRIDAAIRSQFSAKAFEESTRPDLIVNWSLGAVNKRQVQSWPTGRFGRGTRYSSYRFTEGTLVLDFIDQSTKQLVWRGIYRDDESNSGKLSKKLENDVKALFEKFPPKK